MNTLKSRYNRKKQGGFALAELMLATMIATALFASIAFYLDGQRRERAAAEYAGWMAQYINAVAAYMSEQGQTPPATLIVTGTDWLKSNTCGGNQAPDEYFLSCNVPSDFNGVYGVAAPEVTFNWGTPSAPTATIDFGTIQTGGEPNPKMAALISAEINRRLEVDGYSHAGAFTVDPTIDPATDPAGFQAALESGNLGAFVDTSIMSTVFVRRDGNTIMTGPLINQNDNWSLIGRDSAGNENATPQDPIASANLNDMYIRAVDSWFSETHELAEEAYRLAVRAPLFVTNVRSGATISKPTCPTGMEGKIYAEPAGFIGGPSATDARLIAGVRTIIDPGWTVTMETLYEGGTGFVPIPDPDMGLIRVTVKCSPI